MVPRPIWSMLAKFFFGGGGRVWEETENGQTEHKPKLKFIYRLEKCFNDLFERCSFVQQNFFLRSEYELMRGHEAWNKGSGEVFPKRRLDGMQKKPPVI
jgi:hypothetical protein